MKQVNVLRRAMQKTRAARILVGAIVGVAMVWGADQTQAANGYFVPEKGQAVAPPGAQSLCQTYRWACATSGQARMSASGEMQVIKQVNSHVNRTTRPVDDRRQYGVMEHWTMPSARGGDCEDYALAKKHALIRRGVSAQKLLIATVLDKKRNSHAVLVYRSARGDLVLDNMTNQIKNWRDTRYVFLRMQDPKNPSRWVNVLSGG